MRIRFLFLLAAAITFSSSEGLSQVIETPKGKIEFVGLENWNLAMIQEKLKYDSPDKIFFAQHDLTDKLGFAGVSCVIYLEDGKPYKFLTVIEPEHAKQIQYLPAPAKSLPAPKQWSDLIRVVEEKKPGFTNALVDYGGTLPNVVTTQKPLLPDEEKTWFRYLQQRRTKNDYKFALRTLAEDGDYRNRAVAAMVLANFADREQTWRSLIAGLRDSNDLVRMTAQKVLVTLTKHIRHPVSVDWLPVADSIHHLLKGTNVYALQDVLKTLLKTNVSPSLAKPLLRDGGGRLLLAYLKAAHREERSLAHQLLVRLSGGDFGFDDRRWGEWVNSLSLKSSNKMSGW